VPVPRELLGERLAALKAADFTTSIEIEAPPDVVFADLVTDPGDGTPAPGRGPAAAPSVVGMEPVR
jgi:hypothetical protein